MKFNDVLLNNDKETAITFQNFISDNKNTWNDVCEEIGYPNSPLTSDGVHLTEHFRCTLLNIKILSLTGKHFFQFYNKKREELFGKSK